MTNEIEYVQRAIESLSDASSETERQSAVIAALAISLVRRDKEIALLKESQDASGKPVRHTPRGFPVWADFNDAHGQEVTVVTSSLATDYCVWVQPLDRENIHLNAEQATTLRNALSSWISSTPADESE